MWQATRPLYMTFLNNICLGAEEGEHTHGDQVGFLRNGCHSLEVQDEESFEYTVECQHCQKRYPIDPIDIMESHNHRNRKITKHDPGKDGKIVNHH